MFDESDRMYGYRRVHAALVRRGEHCGPELVRDLVRDLGLVPCQPRPWRPTTTQPGDGADAVPDLVGRDFSAEVPGRKLVGGITYLPTWEGFAYLTTVIDCCTKEGIGYAIAEHMRTELVIDALRTVVGKAGLTLVDLVRCRAALPCRAWRWSVVNPGWWRRAQLGVSRQTFSFVGSPYHEAASMILRRRFDAAVFGHTHAAEMATLPEGLYVNSAIGSRAPLTWKSTKVSCSCELEKIRPFHDARIDGAAQGGLLH